MKKVFIILAILSGFLIIRMVYSSATAETAIMAENNTPQATPTAAKTKKPTKPPTPEIDHAATLAAANAQLDSVNATSEIYQLTANAAIALQVAATAAQDQRAHERNMEILALENKRANIELTTIGLTSTAQAPYQTERAVIHSIEIGILTMESSKITQTVEAPALIKKNIDAQYYDDAKKAENFILYSLGIGFLLVVMILTIRTTSAVLNNTPDVEPTELPPGDLPAGDYIAGMWMPALEEHITRSQIRDIAYGYFVRGKALTHSNWTPAKKNGISEIAFKHFQHTLVFNDFAKWGDPTHKSGIILNQKGWVFLYRFLPKKYIRTTPPLKKQDSEPLPQRLDKTDRQPGGENGEGEADHIEPT